MEQAGTSGIWCRPSRGTAATVTWSDPTYPTLMAALLRWVEEGTRPTPASIASQCPALEATLARAALLCGIPPAALNTRVPERAPQ